MAKPVAIIGAGVSGLTTAVALVEAGCDVAIFADEIGQQTTSAAAAAIWFPYDAEPAEKIIPWALETYQVLAALVDGDSCAADKLDRFKRSSSENTGVSMIELRQFSRNKEIEIPAWAHSLGASVIPSEAEGSLFVFQAGFSLNVPLMDTTIYLDYLRHRLARAGGAIHAAIHFENLEDLDPKFDLLINCSGFGAKALLRDADLEPHRGQVAIVPKIDHLNCAVVCDDPPLMYAIPRANDCVFGGTNEISDIRQVDREATSHVLAECSRVLGLSNLRITAEKVGLRPFRKSGVRVERAKLSDGRSVIHNYGHGGAGFTLSWGCAREVRDLALGLTRRR